MKKIFKAFIIVLLGFVLVACGNKNDDSNKDKVVPTVELIDISETQKSIRFDLSIIDVDQVGTVTSITLYKGNELVESLNDLTVREFTGLLSNKLYEIRVTYTYDLNDGGGKQAVVATTQVTTEAKDVPIVELIDVLETQESIGFDLSITDIDQVGIVTSISLYKGNKLVESLNDLTLREFTGLLANDLYEIRVTYTYDLNDGAGAQTVVAIKEIVTYSIPIEVTNISVLNTTNPKVGEEVHVRVSFNNPSMLDIKSFYINTFFSR